MGEGAHDFSGVLSFVSTLWSRTWRVADAGFNGIIDALKLFVEDLDGSKLEQVHKSRARRYTFLSR